ncbi:MAG: type II toxin-antitoxin system RelE/ParE family toxin [Veillonella sp.]|uniref:type II toxin-antitoxin system RelE/ParE family toxin n=1 Tax=Veillonella sp. TaxID=1926307 RepID=UPI0025EEDF67|nr:type II toxin-antitoxin system RelE/ParE family toxin [Veillonella sp.]MBE6080315.1 type II toxin-antitoxin system RelE/ParE family toxin [Veillonella sp.]
MTYTVILSRQAAIDLQDIYQYIALTLLSPNNAANMRNKLKEAILSLKTFPERYRIYPKEPLKSQNIRIFPLKSYIILYNTDTTSNIVNILRVMYGKRNIPNHLVLHENREIYSPAI